MERDYNLEEQFEKMDFTQELNKIKKAKFSIVGLAGLLNKYDIVVE